jgi:hypothetical protein
VNAVRWDMHLHGAKFIIIEFLAASAVVAWVFIASLNYYSSRHINFWGILWISFFFAILLNCIAIALIAIKIKQKEGRRPVPKYKIRMELIALTLILFILIPFIPLFVAYRDWKSDK